MVITRSKILALAVAVGYLTVIIYVSGEDAAVNVLRSMIWLGFSLMLIWFPEELGGNDRLRGKGRLHQPGDTGMDGGRDGLAVPRWASRTGFSVTLAEWRE